MKLASAVFLSAALTSVLAQPPGGDPVYFTRIATFPACLQLDETCDTNDDSRAEIIDATADGMTLVYSDSDEDAVGVVNITDPENPLPMGLIEVGGDTTSVTVMGNTKAAALVDTSEDDVLSGKLVVVDLPTMAVEEEFEIGGQPTGMGQSPDGTCLVLCVENQADGDRPHLPAGFVVVVDTETTPWTLTPVDITGLPGVRFPEDPEPEHVSINALGIAVVTLQENNAVVLLNCSDAQVLSSFTMGVASFTGVDTEEEFLIDPSVGELDEVPREPDGVAWIAPGVFATADEGALDGGTRGFTIWDAAAQGIIFTSGNSMDLEAIKVGHYNDQRSGNRGNEPENIMSETFGSGRYLFVLSERSHLTYVYDISGPGGLTNPKLHQVLPCGSAPEGVVAIPDRNLLVVASDEDDRDQKVRSSVTIYRYGAPRPNYPVLESTLRPNGFPIPFSALSGLAAGDDDTLYTVQDYSYDRSKVLEIDVSSRPYMITREIFLRDANDLLLDVLSDLPDDAVVFIRINDDKTVNLDLEGISMAQGGGWWVVSEGFGDDFPREGKPNLLLKIAPNGVIDQVVMLPPDVNGIQDQYGFEGVAEAGKWVVIAFEGSWGFEPFARIGLYNTETEEWKFAFYFRDARESQNGGRVGLFDIASIGEGQFLVIEADNQAGPDAAIKRIYKIDLGDLDMFASGTRIGKTLIRDVIPDIKETTRGLVFETLAGLTVGTDGRVWMNNDNHGVWDSNGEQHLWDLGPLDLSAQVENPCPETDEEEIDPLPRNFFCGTRGLIQPCGRHVFTPLYYKDNGCPVRIRVGDFSCMACNSDVKAVDVRSRGLCAAGPAFGGGAFNLTISGGPGTHISYDVEICNPSGDGCKTVMCTACVERPNEECAARLTEKRGMRGAAGGEHGGEGGTGYLHQQCPEQFNAIEGMFECGTEE